MKTQSHGSQIGHIGKTIRATAYGWLEVDDRVFTIEGFLEKVTAENPALVDYRVPIVQKDYFGNIDLADSFFDTFRQDYPPYHPRMMVKVLLYAECVGVRSSRKIEKRLVEDVAFRALGAGNTPAFRTIAEFRSQHLKELAGLFAQVLTVCWKSGLVSLKHVALDGAKIRANASKHKAMSYGRMKETRARLEKEMLERFRSNERLDEEEDRKFGFDKRGDELPEEEAACSADVGRPAEAVSTPPRKKRGPKPKYPPGTPKDKDQRNFTDRDSRIVKNSDKAFIQAYNAQAIVDGKSQIIVAADLTNKAADATRLPDIVCTAHNILKLFRSGR